MSIRAKLILVTLFLGIFFTIISMVRRRNLELKYVLLWMLSDIVLLLFAIFPGLMRGLARLLGIQSQMNMIFFLGVLFSLAILFSLTVMLSRLSNKIRRMAQLMAILPEDMKRDLDDERYKEALNEKK